MKKAKLMLSALGVLAIVAASFAFKAKNYENHGVYTGSLNSGSCTTFVSGRAIATGTAAVAASISSTTSGCPNVFTTTTTD